MRVTIADCLTLLHLVSLSGQKRERSPKPPRLRISADFWQTVEAEQEVAAWLAEHGWPLGGQIQNELAWRIFRAQRYADGRASQGFRHSRSVA